MIDSIPSAAPASLFICYRRDDSGDVAGRIYDRLVNEFGVQAVFKDVDCIPIGVDFRKYIGEILGRCKVALVIIGPDWMGERHDEQARRIEDASDHFRVEIETALSREDLIVVPVLVRSSVMPRQNELPPSIATLVYRNAAVIRRDPDFHGDIQRLIRSLHPLLLNSVDSTTTSTQPASRTDWGAQSLAEAPPSMIRSEIRSELLATRLSSGPMPDVVVLFGRNEAAAAAHAVKDMRDLGLLVNCVEDPGKASDVGEDRTFGWIRDAIVVIGITGSWFGNPGTKTPSLCRELLKYAVEKESRHATRKMPGGASMYLIIVVNTAIQPTRKIDGLPPKLADRAVFHCPYGALTENVKNLVSITVQRYKARPER